VAAFEHRIRVATGVVREFEAYEPSGSWGADMKTRLIAGVERTLRADRALLRHKMTGKTWAHEYDDLSRAAQDLLTPLC
jgi:hypothetical protein